MITFGEFITHRRKELGLTQKEVAARIKQDDGKALSVQYLNDIERTNGAGRHPITSSSSSPECCGLSST